MDPSADAPETAAAEPASASADMSIEQLLAEAEASQPASTQPPTDTPPNEEPKGDEPKVEAKPEEKADEPKAEEKPEAKDDGISEKRARQILDAASRKHKAAETHTQNFVQNVKRELVADPSAALEKYFGISLDGLIDISTGITPSERPAAKPVEDEPDWAKQLRSRLDSSDQRAQQAAYEAKAAEIKSAVAADAKAFPTINERGSQALVIDFMEEYFQQHRVPIAWEQAAKLVESDLAKFFGTAKAEPAPAKTTPVTPPKPTTALVNGDVRTTAPVDEEPTDPDELIKFLTQKEEARLARRVS